MSAMNFQNTLFQHQARGIFFGQPIYLKPNNQDRLIYKAICLRKNSYKEGYIQISEYK